MKTNSSISFSFIGIYNWCLINANDAVLPPGAACRTISKLVHYILQGVLQSTLLFEFLIF